MIYLRADGHKATITKDLPITTGTVVADIAYVGELVEVPPQVMTKLNNALESAATSLAKGGA